jgi:hypothetical protein
VTSVSPGIVPGSAPNGAWLYRHLQALLDQAAQFAETDLEPERFHALFMPRLLEGCGAAVGAFWETLPSGGVQLSYQTNLASLGCQDDDLRVPHEQVLRSALQSPQPMVLPPHCGPGTDAANPTAYTLLLAPILVDGQSAGVLEVGREAACPLDMQNMIVQFLTTMAHCASVYLRNRQRRLMQSQQQLWTRLEAFSQQVHASLHLREVACIIANQGRQLIECDRIAVVQQDGRRTTVEAVSGVETIDARARQMRLLRDLGERVLAWGETLVYRGEAQESLPPAVLTALNAYLKETECRLLVALPMHDGSTSAQFALVMECFEAPTVAEVLVGRLEVLGRHSRGALHNAAVYRRVPVRFLWQWLARLRKPGGTLGLTAAIAVVGIGVALVGLPWPLKMEATGQLLPRERRWVYAPGEGQVLRFEQGLQPGATVVEGQALVLMHDTQLEIKLAQLAGDIAAAQGEIASLTAEQTTARTDAERISVSAERKQKEFLRDRKLAELKALRERHHADESRPGCFWLTAPMSGTMLTWDFRERWTNRFVRPSEPLLRLGDRGHGWEVETKIPYQHLAPILEAFTTSAELDVDLLLLSAPTRTFKGKLARQQLAAEASPDPDSSDATPVVRASVRLDGPDIAAADQVPRELLVSGTEVHARVNCGPRRLGQSLFHGVWEFLYEKVLFQ